MDLPSPGFLVASGLIGTVGFALLIYGKRRRSSVQMLGGVVLMIFPYFVANVPAMVGIAVGIFGLTWLATRQGW